MRRLIAALAFAALSPAASLAAAPAATDAGAKAYQRCAVCHLPTGAGVPGAFPALAGRTALAAANDAGRSYLIMTVANGVMGEIDVDGQKYRGVMQAQSGLTDADIAAVLNYTVQMKPAKPAAAKLAPKSFTAAEVAAVRAKHAKATPNSVHAMRANAFSPAPSGGK